MNRAPWDARIARAQRLTSKYGFAAAILRFYEVVANAQADVYARVHAACGDARIRRKTGTLREELDLTILLPELRAFLGAVEKSAPAPLAAAARRLASGSADACAAQLTKWWRDPCAEATAAAPTEDRFCTRAFMEPYAEFLAQHTEPPMMEITPSVCPLCGAKPQFGVLRPEGDGARRSLVCCVCATEWNYGRILCPACGESSENQLAVYIAEEIPNVRVEACDVCQKYMKTVDLTKDGHSVPVVDELAAIPLDLWARERGYEKIQGNLMGM